MPTFTIPGPEPDADVQYLRDGKGWSLGRDGADWVLSGRDGVIAGPMPWDMVSFGYRGTMSTLDTEEYERIRALLWEPEDGPPPKGVGTLQLLEQDQWWTPREGQPVRVGDMDQRYRGNVLRFLERKADQLKFRYELRLVSGPQPSGDMACDAFDGACSQLFEQSAMDWLREQPLYQKLSEES